ncbi:MAG: alcohol dehydrogenase family protein [Proteobacteria bacterium]|nr:alcohol dehydrogenase family protein [Pseudomonadota bacterium]
MKAITFAGHRAVEYETVADPRIEESSDVIIRVELAGVCGSDLHPYNGREQGLDRGTPMGHEFVGEVVEAGSQVTSLTRGDRVYSPFTTSCGQCFYCREGLTSRCQRGQVFGWVSRGQGLSGGQAEYVRVPLADTTALAVPADISEEKALLLGDVFSTGYFCAEMAGVSPTGTSVVIGCGPVGLFAIIAARHLGAQRVFAVDSVAERLDLARRFGATAIDFTSEDPVSIVGEATDGRGADAVMEAVGSPASQRAAIALIRPGGTISVVGVHTEEQMAFSPVTAYDYNLTYRVGRCPARAYMERLVPVVRDQLDVDITEVISHRLPLARGAEGYRMFDERRDGCTKVVLKP